jgi:hypothetical protein
VSRLRGQYRAVIKRLSAVESEREESNQHELNGTGALRALLGDERRTHMDARWIVLADDREPVIQPDTFTWYNARANVPTRSAEWRLYYREEPSIFEGDLLCALMRPENGELALLVAREGSSWESQLLLLFGNPDLRSGSFHDGRLEEIPTQLASIAVDLFELLGWTDSAIETELGDIEAMIEKFGDRFPTTREFSDFARTRVTDQSDSPDDLLLSWWEMEEGLFRAFEDRQLAARLERTPPFTNAEEFISFSLSVQNRRKSRAGQALENHMETLLAIKKIKYSRGARTEGNRRPDFVLPGAAEYHDEQFPPERLMMLAAKTTCKDRWRQVLDEAERIRPKHLLTLEAGISSDQLKQMGESGVVLVAPRRTIETYTVPPGMRAISLSEFFAIAANNQQNLP